MYSRVMLITVALWESILISAHRQVSWERIGDNILQVVRGIRVLTIWVAWRVAYKRQEQLTLREHLSSSQVFGRVCVAHLFRLLGCVVFFVLSYFLFLLAVFLDCPFLFTPMGFSNVYSPGTPVLFEVQYPLSTTGKHQTPDTSSILTIGI